MEKTYQGHIVDVTNRRIFDGKITVADGKICKIAECSLQDETDVYLMPGFIDSHVHVESSMMVPAEFARVAVEHGTIGIVSDPHEIANVLGEEGVGFMIDSSKQVNFNFCFGAPSCVPSCGTDIETSGAILDSKSVERLLARPEIGYLSEMMNYPGVLGGDAEVMAKIEAARRHGKPVDGHAPGLVGDDRKRYVAAGISTDHECSTIEEGRSCVEAGMKVLIREGSAAKDYDALKPLISEAPDMVMFCTDDSHPADLVQHHINGIVQRALGEGFDMWNVLRAACLNPQQHYDLNWGLLREGDPATFIAMDMKDNCLQIKKTIINGECVFDKDSADTFISIESQAKSADNYPNKFYATPITESDIAYELKPGDTAHIIIAEDGSLLTQHDVVEVPENRSSDTSYPWNEVQKIVVYNRYDKDARPRVGLVRGFGIKDGAMAASVAHDCHNIVAVGSSDKQIVAAINRVIEMRGGEVAINGDTMTDIALPIGGIMSPLDGHQVAALSQQLCDTIADAGCTMKAPFITVAFMCLPVIPNLKLTDKGLFDSISWKFI